MLLNVFCHRLHKAGRLFLAVQLFHPLRIIEDHAVFIAVAMGAFFGLPAPDAGKPRRGTGMGRDSIRCFPMGGAVLGTDPPELTQNASSDIMQTERENAPAPGLLRMQGKARDCSGKDSGECPRRLSPWIVPEDRPGNGCGARTGSSTGSSTGNLLPAQTRPDPGTAGGLAEIPQIR